MHTSGHFPSTRWSLIIRAGANASPQDRAALSELCGVYWYPIYAFVRRTGKTPHDALDLTQAFFARVIERDVLAAADAGRGHFRSFLLTACRNFLVDEHRRGARKRPAFLISIDGDAAEDRYRIEPVDGLTPEQQLDRAWAVTLLDRALALLAADYERRGKGALFQRLKPALSQRAADVGASALASELGTTVGAVHTAVHRMRTLYREILMREVSATLDDGLSSEEEMQRLFEAVRG
jgi:RNA polymerase sigma-70 factor (ECF subfamily)